METARTEERDGGVRVVYRKQLSDGNYGTETAEVSMSCPFDFADEGGITPPDLARSMLQDCRKQVLGLLSESPSDAVKRAVALRHPLPSDVGDTPF